MVRPSHPMSASIGFTTVTQCQITESTTTLKIMGDRGSPCVTPNYPLNGRLKYLPALATMVSWSQCVQRSRTFLGPTPYAARSSRPIYRSKAS